LDGKRTDLQGAPEIDKLRKGTRTAVEQTIDTWSFGCVLSITATWIVLGFQGVLQYETVRKLAIQKLREQRGQNLGTSTPAADDAFHNGREVLPEVLRWHDYLRSILRKTDTATEWVLYLVEDKMLRASPSDRIRSRELSTELKHILDRAKREGKRQEKIHGSVLEALLQFDRSAPSNEMEAAKAKHIEKVHHHGQKAAHEQNRVDMGSNLHVVTGSIHRSVRINKSEQLASVPLAKTAHRAEILEKILDVPPLRPVPVDRPPEDPPVFLNRFEAEPEEIAESSTVCALPSQLGKGPQTGFPIHINKIAPIQPFSSYLAEQTLGGHQPVPPENPKQHHDLNQPIMSSGTPFDSDTVKMWTDRKQTVPNVEHPRPSQRESQPEFIVTPPMAAITSPISPLIEEADKFQAPTSDDTPSQLPLREEISLGKLHADDAEGKEVVFDQGPVSSPIIAVPPILHEHYDICEVRMELDRQAKESRSSLKHWSRRNPKKDAYLKDFIIDRDIVSA
jgi:hypothetical protein